MTTFAKTNVKIKTYLIILYIGFIVHNFCVSVVRIWAIFAISLRGTGSAIYECVKKNNAGVGSQNV